MGEKRGRKAIDKEDYNAKLMRSAEKLQVDLRRPDLSRKEKDKLKKKHSALKSRVEKRNEVCHLKREIKRLNSLYFQEC